VILLFIAPTSETEAKKEVEVTAPVTAAAEITPTDNAETTSPTTIEVTTSVEAEVTISGDSEAKLSIAEAASSSVGGTSTQEMVSEGGERA